MLLARNRNVLVNMLFEHHTNTAQFPKGKRPGVRAVALVVAAETGLGVG